MHAVNSLLWSLSRWVRLQPKHFSSFHFFNLFNSLNCASILFEWKLCSYCAICITFGFHICQNVWKCLPGSTLRLWLRAYGVEICRHVGESLSSHSSQLSLYLITPSEPDTNCSLCSGNKYDHACIGTTVRDREIEKGREREGVGVCVCLPVSLCVLFTGSSVNSKFTITTRLSLKLKCLFFQC